MITMLWKELRENAKWGALALLGLLMAEFYAINQQQFFGFYVQEAVPLCKSSFLMITTFGCAATGLVLGLVQMLPEQRRDQWAALIHRPVSRATIFRGKAVAGLLIYLIATVVPFAACAWYAAVPGHFAAPFTPRMILPGVADICAGAMYYFAALFVSLQRGAWYGTRAFGVLAALSGSFFLTGYWLMFYVGVEAVVLMSLALFTAAWGAMLTNGTFSLRPWLARFATLAVVFYGVCVSGAIGIMIWGAFEKAHYYEGRQYVIDLDGRPLLTTYKSDGSRTFADLAGNVVNDPKLQGGLGYQNMLNMYGICSYVGNPHGSGLTQGFNQGYRNGESYASSIYAYDQGINNEAWFYLPKERVFSGFNTATRTTLGSIGLNGFARGTAQAAPFKRLATIGSGNIQQLSIARFGRTVYYINFVDRAAQPLLTAEGISGAGSITPSKDADTLQGLGGVALPDKLVLIDKNKKVFATLSYDRDMDHWGSLSVGIKSAQGPIYLEYNPSGWIPWQQSRSMPSYLEQLDLQGHVLNSYTLPPIDQPSGSRTWRQWTIECLRAPAYFYGEIVYEKIGAMLGSGHLAGALHQKFSESWGYTKDVGTRISIVSLILAAFTFAWARRREFTRAESWKWALFVLAFNLAGLITFRLVADWPVRIPCPSCARKRRVDEPNCMHCQVPWPTPLSDGTEIFNEPAVVTTSEEAARPA